MREKSAIEHPSLSVRCPFCQADPGTPCVTRSGRECDWPHTARVRITDPMPPAPVKQALCCDCGQVRTYRDAWRARNALKDRQPNDRWTQRWVGALKCAHCSATTTHALLTEPDSIYRDSDEREQLLALGDKPRNAHERMRDLDRLRRDYRDALPRNPHLKHRFWIDAATKAWDEGHKQVTAVCGEPDTINTDPRTWPGSKQKRAKNDGFAVAKQLSDTEYEDTETGLWWIDMDCVDCCRVFNEHRRAQQQERLHWFLARFLSRSSLMNDANVAEVLRCLENIYDQCVKNTH